MNFTLAEPRHALRGIAFFLFASVYLVFPASAQAQADPACELAKAVIGSLFRGTRAAPCSPSKPTAGTTGATYSGGIDTPENEQRVRTGLEEIYRSMDPSRLEQDPSAGLDACMRAMQPFARFERMLDSRYDELNKKCASMQAPMQQQLQTAAAESRATRAQAKAAEQHSQQQQESERVAQIVAELKAGTRKPANCAQYMLTKGHDPEALSAPVMHVAYRAPTGIGIFTGVVDRIEGGTIVLNGRIPDLMRLSVNPPEHMLAIAGKDSQVFGGDRIAAGRMLEGFAVQSGTRSVTLSDRRVITVAVMSVHCMQPK